MTSKKSLQTIPASLKLIFKVLTICPLLMFLPLFVTLLEWGWDQMTSKFICNLLLCFTNCFDRSDFPSFWRCLLWLWGSLWVPPFTGVNLASFKYQCVSSIFHHVFTSPTLLPVNIDGKVFWTSRIGCHCHSFC